MYGIDTKKALKIESELRKNNKRLWLLSNRIEDIQKSLTMYMNEPEINKKLHIQYDRLADESEDFRQLADGMQRVVQIYNNCETNTADYLEEVKISNRLEERLIDYHIPEWVTRLVGR